MERSISKLHSSSRPELKSSVVEHEAARRRAIVARGCLRIASCLDWVAVQQLNLRCNGRDKYHVPHCFCVEET